MRYFKVPFTLLSLTALMGASSGLSAQDAKKAPPAPPLWEATGTLLEACSCLVPCPCNFGQPPVPAGEKSGGYCHTIYAYRLKTAHYGAVKLDGLVFGGGEADGGAMGFLDDRATPAQKPALEKLALAVFGKGGASGGMRRFVFTPIVAEDDTRHFKLDFGNSGGFTAAILTGRDGKNPVIVENNTTWPVKRFVKGKTSAFDYHDALGNRLKLSGVNANLGEFRLSDGPNSEKAGSSCCGTQK